MATLACLHVEPGWLTHACGGCVCSERRNTLGQAHTHVGIGIAITPQEFRLVEVYADKHVEVLTVRWRWWDHGSALGAAVQC